MSALAKRPFASVAPFLAEYGYSPVPIKPGYKAPLLGDWQAGHPPNHYLPRCAAWGTGILTRNCPAIDLDIRDRELVRVLIELAGEMLGPSPFRIGAPPKALLPFSTAAPFEKISGKWWGLPGEDFDAENYGPHRIEILCDGQQFVAFAKHPRGTWYRWRRYSPMSIMREALPTIDETEAKAFLATAEKVLQRVGAIPLKRQNKVWIPDLRRPAQTVRRGNLPVLRPGSGWRRLDPGTLAKAIDAKHAARTRNGWITSCPAHRSEGHRSLHVTPRDGGGSVVHCFGECSFVEIAREIEVIVGRAA
jgi:hypothetical protein